MADDDEVEMPAFGKLADDLAGVPDDPLIIGRAVAQVLFGARQDCGGMTVQSLFHLAGQEVLTGDQVPSFLHEVKNPEWRYVEHGQAGLVPLSDVQSDIKHHIALVAAGDRTENFPDF